MVVAVAVVVGKHQSVLFWLYTYFCHVVIFRTMHLKASPGRYSSTHWILLNLVSNAAGVMPGCVCLFLTCSALKPPRAAVIDRSPKNTNGSGLWHAPIHDPCCVLHKLKMCPSFLIQQQENEMSKSMVL